jgi:hypothetical protein
MKITQTTGIFGACMSEADNRRFTRFYSAKVPQQITEEGMRKLREYITQDLDVTADLRANLGLPVSPPRPTLLHVAVQLALSLWSK